MSAISDMKRTLGVDDLTMRYEDGGKVEVYRADGIEYRFVGGAPVHTVTEVILAGRKALGPNSK